MLRAYTREKPARRGLAIGTLGAVFAGTVCLALLLTHRRTPPLVEYHEFADWPVTFAVPRGYTLQTAYAFLDDPDPARAGGVAIFSPGDEAGARTIQFEYRWLSPGTPQDQAVRATAGVAFEDTEPIDVGPEPGRMVGRLRTTGYELVATTCRGDGLAVTVTYRPTTIDAREVREFERICRAIGFEAGRSGAD
ncbi:MAG: hypothetical protein ACE5F9_10110 [Phycisphaerae bacterium]